MSAQATPAAPVDRFAQPLAKDEPIPQTVDWLRAFYEVARKEVLQNIRTKRVLIIGILFFVTIFFFTLVLPVWILDLGEHSPGTPAGENMAMMGYLNASIVGGGFMIQLLAMVLTADAVCSEWQSRTIFLLLSKPVPRSAFVIGKYAGAMVTVLATYILIFSFQYVILLPAFEGTPSGEEVGRFFGALGVLAIAAGAVAAVALVFSTITRSTAQAVVFTLLAIMLVFPIVGNIGDIMAEVDEEHGPVDHEDWKYDWSHYLSPERSLAVASDVMVEGYENDVFALGGVVPSLPPARPWLSVTSGIVMAVGFVGLAVLIVKRRNFE